MATREHRLHLDFPNAANSFNVPAMNPRALLAFATLIVSALPSAAAENELTAAEKQAGWQLLFDGKTFSGWRGYLNKPIAGWDVQDGTLHAIAKTRGVELITEKKYHDFELTWEWKLPPAGNNGVKYFVTEDRPSAPGHEYQMLDDLRHPDSKAGPLRHTAAFYFVLPAAADKPYREPGEWNQSKIVVRGKTVEHWLNGRNVLTYEIGSEAVRAGIAKSKFANQPGFGEKIAGHIMLTYHSDDCWYRNIKLRELK
jgi:hypothetical protein